MTLRLLHTCLIIVEYTNQIRRIQEGQILFHLQAAAVIKAIGDTKRDLERKEREREQEREHEEKNERMREETMQAGQRKTSAVTFAASLKVPCPQYIIVIFPDIIVCLARLTYTRAPTSTQ
jgi:hypothetical protein